MFFFIMLIGVIFLCFSIFKPLGAFMVIIGGLLFGAGLNEINFPLFIIGFIMLLSGLLQIRTPKDYSPISTIKKQNEIDKKEEKEYGIIDYFDKEN